MPSLGGIRRTHAKSDSSEEERLLIRVQLVVPPGALALRTPQGLGHAGLRPVLVEVHLMWQRELLQVEAA